MGIWTDYTKKDTPEDNDALMLYDSAAKANKQTLFSGFWKWIAKKLKEATLSDLTTTSKTLIGAVNELNSNPTIKYAKVYGTSLTIKNVRTAVHGIIMIDKLSTIFYIGGSATIGYSVTIAQALEGVTIDNDERTININTKKTQLITCFYCELK